MSGPVVIGFDGTPSAEAALSDTARLLGPHPALVVVVVKAGIAFRLVAAPATAVGLPPADLDVRTASEADAAMNERARQLAEQGAAMARDLGLDAEGLAVADEPEITVAETLVDVARQRDADAIAVGVHDHGGAIGPITRDVVRRAPCPVLVRGPGR
jgi:nucleotide-binding universal stress UspA family protein